MELQLQEIQSIYISQNRLVEGKDYKRAEWLKKLGWARIDIPTNYNMVDSVTTYFKHYGGTTGQMPIFGGDKIHALLWQLWNISSTNKGNRLDTYFNGQYFFDIPVTEGKFKVKFNWQTKKRLISWNDVNKGGWTNCALDKTNTKISVLDCKIFNQSWHTHTGALAMKYFFLAPNIYLYPCQLLQDIPATLDANGIARSAGECGMVDSISGKFYGNVASSGSFSVEGLDESGTVEDTRLHQIYKNKLVEGEDYMIGEWLKADIPISTSMMGLPINSKNFEFERNFIQSKNTSYFSTYADSGVAYSYFIQDYYPKIYNAKLKNTIFTGKKLGSGVHTIIANDNGIVISSATNTTTLRWYGNPQLIVFNNASNANVNTIHLTSSIKVDGVTRYAPCRLLRSIPRNLDAQCKPRVAGECGMIDLISGRFYGNVASSGAFSLEWDEWLKDCSIQFNPETTLGYNTSIPNDYVIYGRIEVAKLTAQYTDFGFMQASNNYIILGESTVYVISDWGTNKWATFVVSYSGGYECSLQLNGVTLTTITSSTPYNEAPHIQLHGIMQINKIEHTFYPNESDPTQSQSETWKRFVDQDGRQGLGNTDMTYKIYAD